VPTVPFGGFARHAEAVADVVPLIDLDAAPSRAQAADEPLRLRLTAPRSVLVAGVLVAVLLLLSAAAPPPPSMRPVLSAGGTAAAAFRLDADALYTASFGQNPNSESAVRRYALPGGKPVWERSLPQNVQHLMVDGGILLARSGSAPAMSFLDAANGRLLWHLESPDTSAVTLAGGKVLLRSDVGGNRTQLRLADARTGATIWIRLVDEASEIGNDDVYESSPQRIVVVGTDGHVTTLRFTDGVVLGEGDLGVRLPVQLDGNFLADFVGVTVSGERVYVSRRERGKSSLTAYGLPGLTVQWRAEGGPVGSVHECGPVLCISDTRWVSGLDPGDGSVRWSDPAWSTAYSAGGDTLIAYDQQEFPESAVLDAATGKLVRKLGRTYVTGGLELRSDTEIAALTWVNVPGAGDGAAHTVGSLATEAPFGCDVLVPYLACPTTAGPTTVYRIP
jgi:putative pyrroloquinoline-quinone binding quinoprotein